MKLNETLKEKHGKRNGKRGKKEANLPVSSLFEQDASQGLENMAQDDLALPFLRILGQLSPQVNKRDLSM